MLIELFEALNQNWPPPKNKRHAILFYSESKTLALGIWTNSDFMSIFSVTEQELLDINKLIADIHLNIGQMQIRS